jgi:hypothetical protein
MKTNRKKQEELKFELKVLPPPTVPPASWAEARADYKRGPVVSGPDDVVAYFKQYIGGKRNEAFLTMYVDHRNHVLDVVLNQEGTVDHTAVYPREVLKKALELDATRIFDDNKIIHFSVTISPL